MALFLVRAGKHGEQEQRALSNNVVTIGWNDLSDLSSIRERDDLRSLFEKTYPNAKKSVVANYVGQIWTFLHRIKLNDLVVLPLKTQSAIAIGEVIGAYAYRNDLGLYIFHTRPVKWIKTDISRSQFDQDLLYSFGAFMTVCQVERNNAEPVCERPGSLRPKRSERRSRTITPICFPSSRKCGRVGIHSIQSLAN